MDEELSRMSDDPMDHQHPIRTLSGQPLEALKKDHQIVKSLFDRYLNTSDVAVKREAGPRILMMLEMHADLEETIFYPKARSVDASLVDHSETEHDEMRQMIQQLRSMQPGDPQCDELYQKLCDTVMDHVEEEENELFPKVRQSNIDLEALGLEMQAYEASMIASHAKDSMHKDSR
jgi:hemerythrin superfamily protein